MTPAQVHTYITKARAVEHTASLREIGLVQLFQAFDPLAHAAVVSSMPRVGMSAEALVFLWGDPYYTAGDVQRYARWYDLISSLRRAEYANQSK